MILLVAAAFTLACALGSLRRLGFVIELTAFDSSLLAGSLRRRPDSLHALEAALVDARGADWERDVLAAVREPPEIRAGLLDEAMTELDFRTRRWIRVPRVAASLSSSFGFLLATLALRVGLARLVGDIDDSQVVSVNAAVLDAVDVAAVGLTGAAFCAAVHYRARTELAARVQGGEALTDVVERLGVQDESPVATPLAAEEQRDSVGAPIGGAASRRTT